MLRWSSGSLFSLLFPGQCKQCREMGKRNTVAIILFYFWCQTNEIITIQLFFFGVCVYMGSFALNCMDFCVRLPRVNPCLFASLRDILSDTRIVKIIYWMIFLALTISLSLSLSLPFSSHSATHCALCLFGYSFWFYVILVYFCCCCYPQQLHMLLDRVSSFLHVAFLLLLQCALHDSFAYILFCRLLSRFLYLLFSHFLFCCCLNLPGENTHCAIENRCLLKSRKKTHTHTHRIVKCTNTCVFHSKILNVYEEKSHTKK